MLNPNAQDVAKLMSDAPMTTRHWQIIFIGALMMMLDGYDLSVMGLVLPAMAEAWKQEPSAFKWALSASLIGVGVGSVLAGFMGDRWGRKSTLLLMNVFGSIACLGTVTANDMPHLILWRFLVGVGMGGAIPNVISLISELMPAKRRAFLIVLVYSGAALGGALGSLLGAYLIPHFGWTSAFYLGGITPLLIAAIVWFAVPESPTFLVARGRNAEASVTIRRLLPNFPEGCQLTLATQSGADAGRTGLSALFSHGRASSTLLIWVLFICTQAMVFFIQSWYVTLLSRAGNPLDTVLRTFSLWDFGALIGGVLVAWLAAKISLEKLLCVAYLMAAVCLFMLSQVSSISTATAIVTFATGFSIVGASFCMGALAATYYPTQIRTTGIGMGLGVGRVGSISSPLIAGSLISAGWTNAQIFTAAIALAIVASAAVLLLSRVGRRAESAEPH
jgi:AAHS family 4-hydroxybenzoate transporter-like MFS transporter